MKKIILLGLSITFSKSYASALPQTKAEFCARFGSGPKDREVIFEMASETTNLMSFKNDGGLMNGGICWWHSRFQRNALYLSIFRPELPKPANEASLKKLIHQIRQGESVVTIPGFANFSDFTSENKKLIQTELNNWQFFDGVLNGGWIDGLKGNSKVSGDLLEKMMGEVFNYVTVKKKIAYEKLQIKGIISHAWLIVGMKKLNNGYDLGIIDSNNPRMSTLYSYKTGDESFFIKGYGDFVPYLEFKREEERITNAGKIFCGIKGFRTTKAEDRRNYKLDLAEAKKSGR